MTDLAKLHQVHLWEDSGLTLLARIQGTDASNIQQADVTSIAYSIYDVSTIGSSTLVDSGTLTVSAVVFDTLQTDARWTLDNTGYNFRWDIAETIFTNPSAKYRVEVKFTPAAGYPYHLVWQVNTKGLFRS